jgi:hypothetical protein
MASLTLSVPEDFKEQLKHFLWVNWSEIAREEAIKKLIFENYIKTGKITDEEWKFCEKIDWHPVDELPLKEDYIKKLEARKKEKSIKMNSVSDIFKNIE